MRLTFSLRHFCHILPKNEEEKKEIMAICFLQVQKLEDNNVGILLWPLLTTKSDIPFFFKLTVYINAKKYCYQEYSNSFNKRQIKVIQIINAFCVPCETKPDINIVACIYKLLLCSKSLQTNHHFSNAKISYWWALS